MIGQSDREALGVTARLSTPLTGRAQHAPSRTRLVIEERRDAST